MAGYWVRLHGLVGVLSHMLPSRPVTLSANWHTVLAGNCDNQEEVAQIRMAYMINITVEWWLQIALDNAINAVL